MSLDPIRKAKAQELFAQGYTPEEVFEHFGSEMTGGTSTISRTESVKAKAQEIPAFQKLVKGSQAVTNFLGLGDATRTFGDALARTEVGASLTGTDVETNREFIKAPTGAQLAGATLDTVATAFSPLIPASLPLKGAALAGGATGYAMDVGSNLAQGDTGAQALTPGVATVAGAVAPFAMRGISMGITAAQAGGSKLNTMVSEAIPDNLSGVLSNKAKNAMRPEISATDAVGQVIQGKTKDVPVAMRAFKNVDTKDVKTYSDLDKRISTSIGDLSTKVDEVLARDTTKTLLRDLGSNITTKKGQEVSTNYVETAFQNLEELYEATGDVASKADLKFMMQKAETEGLTKLEVNSLSRIYNQEFGQKAFSKIGDPLTSVNAQKYETVRKGLKLKAREGMGGTEAEALDKDISALIGTQRLVKNNVEAVNKLQQRIQERGLLEKVGHGVSKAFDMISGGSLRGIVGGLLPRGAGYKTMNALDLEEQLADNLEIIKKALAEDSDEALIKAAKEITAKQAD